MNQNVPAQEAETRSGPATPGCILFEDDHLLVADKPAGMNTHSPSPVSGEGLYEWLRHREPRWAELAIHQRLDKETSGVIVFGKSTVANRSLTAQFTGRAVRKTYLLWTDRAVAQPVFTATSSLVRSGERYLSRPLHAGGDQAETQFRVLGTESGRTIVEAQPLTGRTHQIRVHAAEHGFPILGDTLYGGTPWGRLCLHAAELVLSHPASGGTMTFRAPADFQADARLVLRQRLIDARETNSVRLVHGASDGWPGWYVDRYGEYLLSQSEGLLGDSQRQHLEAVAGAEGIYHKLLTRRVGHASPAAACPQWVSGRVAPERFQIRENGLRFELSFAEGYSVGLFLDQRDNRRRFLRSHVAAGFPMFDGGMAGREVLNAFAYTCGFSVCAAKAGARTTSVDLSRKYLAWGRQNFALNDLDPAAHEFLFGDVFDWLRRLAKKRRLYDAVVLDPPTFSRSKEQGVFRAEKDFGRLVSDTLPLLKPGGVLLASTNAAGLAPEEFIATVTAAFAQSGRRVLRQHYVPQPPDFPVTREEPAYLKTLWVQAS